MRLRHKFIASAVLIHAVLIALSLLLLQYNKLLFVGAEILIIISVAVTLHLYRAFLKPLNLLSAGVESIKDRDFSTTFRSTGHRELDRLVEVYNAMIEQLRAERVRVREQHYFLERLIDATPIAVVILDLDDKVTLINPAACTMLNTDGSAAAGRSLQELSGRLGCAIGGMRAGETRVVRISGIQTYKCRKSHFFDRGFHRHFVLIEELTREIVDTQKRAYAKVVRMMSHEVNNSIGAVNSILNSALHYAPQLQPDDREDFEQALQVALDRNTGLNTFMSNFADVVRIPAPNREACDIHEMLGSLQYLMSAECERRGITWVSELARRPFVANVDAQQMEQVLVNVFKNAIEAIGQDGTITVTTRGAPPRTLRVTDTGKGITPDERAQLFTPFYSTKKNGQGVGLTLVREILVNHGFDFNLESTPPGQTEFWIDFDRPHANG
jgi:two-component system nitrogen regulation sensor histidine kinase NtrY